MSTLSKCIHIPRSNALISLWDNGPPPLLPTTHILFFIHSCWIDQNNDLKIKNSEKPTGRVVGRHPSTVLSVDRGAPPVHLHIHTPSSLSNLKLAFNRFAFFPVAFNIHTLFMFLFGLGRLYPHGQLHVKYTIENNRYGSGYTKSVGLVARPRF